MATPYLPPPPTGSDTNAYAFQDWFTKLTRYINSGSGGGGGSGVSSVSAGTNITITGTSTNPIINSTGASGTVTGLSGDVSGAGTGVINTTLATVNSTPGGTYNNFTVNAKGLVTASYFQEYVPVFGTQGTIMPSTDPFFSSVSLLYHFDDTPGSTTFVDSSSYTHTSTRTIAAGGVLTTQTGTSKFGGALQATSSIGGNYLAVNAQASEMQMGTSDFTFECWFLVSTINVSHCIAAQGVTGGWRLTIATNNKLNYTSGGANAGTTTLAANTWYFVAVSRVGTTTKVFLNGVQEMSFTDTLNYTATPFSLGGASGVSFSLTGYLDEVRLTKGVGRYTTAFTPPTTPFSSPSYPIGGPRMTDDFSNSVISNRYIFQSSIVNGITDVGATPNGTATTASYTVYNNVDVNNSPYFQVACNSTTAVLNSASYGSGLPLPISIKVGSSEVVNVSSIGLTATNVTTPGLATLNNLSVGTAGQFVVGNTGNITKINNVVTSWPTSNTTGVLTNNGSGTLTWVATGTITKSTIRSVSASTTLAATDSTLIVDTTSAALVITLPTPSTVTGQTFVIKNFPAVAANVHNLTISGFTIDYTPSGSFVLSSAGSSVAIQSNGTIYLTV